MADELTNVIGQDWIFDEDASIIRAAMRSVRNHSSADFDFDQVALDRCRTVKSCSDRYTELCAIYPKLLTLEDKAFDRDYGRHAATAVKENQSWFQMTWAIEDASGHRPSEKELRRWFFFWLKPDDRDDLNLERIKKDFPRFDSPMYASHDADIKSFDFAKHIREGGPED